MGADFGPQARWPVEFLCDVSAESPSATGFAVDFATDVLWAMTGMRFGTSSVKLRPCRRICRATPYPGGMWEPWPGVGWGSLPVGGGGGWNIAIIGAGCSQCGDACSCTTLSEIMLPAPVNSIVEVRLDGAVLTGSAYRVDNNRLLERIDGNTWPYCQNLLLDDTQVGTFSVTALYGEDVPSGAPLAMGELACQVLKSMHGEDCQLPTNITNLTRQGVSITLPDLTMVLQTHDMLGLRLCDLFIKTWNPSGLKMRAKTFSVDGTLARRAGT